MSELAMQVGQTLIQELAGGGMWQRVEQEISSVKSYRALLLIIKERTVHPCGRPNRHFTKGIQIANKYLQMASVLLAKKKKKPKLK